MVQYLNLVVTLATALMWSAIHPLEAIDRVPATIEFMRREWSIYARSLPAPFHVTVTQNAVDHIDVQLDPRLLQCLTPFTNGLLEYCPLYPETSAPVLVTSTQPAPSFVAPETDFGLQVHETPSSGSQWQPPPELVVAHDFMTYLLPKIDFVARRYTLVLSALENQLERDLSAWYHRLPHIIVGAAILVAFLMYNVISWLSATFRTPQHIKQLEAYVNVGKKPSDARLAKLVARLRQSVLGDLVQQLDGFLDHGTPTSDGSLGILTAKITRLLARVVEEKVKSLELKIRKQDAVVKWQSFAFRGIVNKFCVQSADMERLERGSRARDLVSEWRTFTFHCIIKTLKQKLADEKQLKLSYRSRWVSVKWRNCVLLNSLKEKTSATEKKEQAADEKIQGLESEIKKQGSQLKVDIKALEDLKNEAKEAETKQKLVQKQLHAAQQTEIKNKKTNEKLQNELKSLKTAVGKDQSYVAQLSKERDTAESVAIAASKEKQTLEIQVCTLKQALEQNQTRLELLTKTNKELVERVETNTKEYTVGVERLQKEANVFKQNIETLQKQLQTFREEKIDAQQRIDTTSRELEAGRSELSKWQEKYKSSEDQQQALRMEMETTKKNWQDDIKTTKAQAEKDLKEAQQSNNASNHENQSLHTMIKQLQQKVEEQDSAIKTASSQAFDTGIATKEKDRLLERLETEMRLKTDEVKNLKSHLETEMRIKTDEVKNLKSQLAQAKNNMEALLRARSLDTSASASPLDDRSPGESTSSTTTLSSSGADSEALGSTMASPGGILKSRYNPDATEFVPYSTPTAGDNASSGSNSGATDTAPVENMPPPSDYDLFKQRSEAALKEFLELVSLLSVYRPLAKDLAMGHKNEKIFIANLIEMNWRKLVLNLPKVEQHFKDPSWALKCTTDRMNVHEKYDFFKKLEWPARCIMAWLLLHARSSITDVLQAAIDKHNLKNRDLSRIFWLMGLGFDDFLHARSKLDLKFTRDDAVVSLSWVYNEYPDELSSATYATLNKVAGRPGQKYSRFAPPPEQEQILSHSSASGQTWVNPIQNQSQNQALQGSRYGPRN